MVPDQYSAIFHHFCADEIRRRFRQQGRAAEYISWPKPEKEKVSALLRDEEVSGSAFS